MPRVQYYEIQKFDQWWMKSLLALSSLTMLGGLFVGYLQEAASLPEAQSKDLLVDYLMIMIAVGIAIAAMVYFIFSHRLELDINNDRLRYRFFPWLAWKEARPEQIKGFEIKEARFVWKYGGWGLRYNPFIGQWAYMVKGKYAMVLYFTSGKSVAMSTSNPGELQKAMNGLLAKNEIKANV